MEDGKYYTPDISEFYVGFEFEMDAGTGWSSQMFPNPWWETGGMGGIKTLRNCLNPPAPAIRVKYLDKSDTDSYFGQGKELDGWVVGYLKDGYTITIWFHRNTARVQVENQINNVIFFGEIKNISELRKLMNRLGLETK